MGNSQDLYAAVFEQRGGVPFEARHGLTADEYQRTFNDLVGRGFRPTVVSGYSMNGRDNYAAVFVQEGGVAIQARHRLTADEYQRTFNDLVGRGFRPTVVSGYSMNGRDHYADVFVLPTRRSSDLRHGLTADEYQRTFNDLVGRGFRPTVVSGYSRKE